MAKVITIAYTAPAAVEAKPIAQICRIFNPNNAAADLSVFDGTYYDTNVEGWGEGMSLEKYFEGAVAHPGLVAALKQAMKDGSYEFSTEDEKVILYALELKAALADQGFAITVAEPVELVEATDSVK